jgi:hypothetical protein
VRATFLPCVNGLQVLGCLLWGQGDGEIRDVPEETHEVRIGSERFVFRYFPYNSQGSGEMVNVIHTTGKLGFFFGSG